MTLQPAVLYPDAEQVVIDYLRTQLGQRSEPFLSGLILGNFVPSPRPDRFLKVRRSGGISTAPTVSKPRIDIEAWAITWADAQDIAALSHALIYTMQNRTPVRSVTEFLGLTPIQDPLSNQPRYLFTLELAMRGAPVTL
jgi:hypothetical protein